MIELAGRKVVLRTLEREDCRYLWQGYEPEDALPSEPLFPGMSIEHIDKWFEDMQEKQGHEQLYLGTYHQRDGRLLGDVQLSNINWRQRSADIGFGITKADDRGKGYSTDAAYAILQFGFDHLDLFRITAVTMEYNTGARRVLEKLNFTQEGRERLIVYAAGKRWDRIRYGLLRNEFKA